MKYTYAQDDLVQAFIELGISQNDTVVVHSDVLKIGIPKEYVEEKKNPCEVIYTALRSVIGNNGTVVVPTFSYSFCKGEVYDVDNTPSDVGSFGNWVRQQNSAVRNADPLFSFTAIGPKAELVNFSGNNSFSTTSSAMKNFFDENVKLLFIGVDLLYFTYIHLAEQMIFGLQHRFDKIFSGTVRKNGNESKVRWIYPVRVNLDNTYPKLAILHDDCIRENIFTKSKQMDIYCGNIVPMVQLAQKNMESNNWAYLTGPKCDLKASDANRTGEESFTVNLSSTDLHELAEKIAPLPRHLISDGYSAALHALASQIPMHIHAYPSGTNAFTWIVPERYICRSARLETLDGVEIFSYADNPLHVVSYSNPFSGIVEREELFKHLHTPNDTTAALHPDAIPFVFKYYERDWGLCCSHRQKESLTDAAYKVVIDSDFSYGALEVGEVIVPGESDECIVLCAHLCHPCQMNDGLSGVLAGLKVMEELRQRKNLRYTYRLLILPETIGSACWLSHNEDKIGTLKGGIFLETLALNYPHLLMHSNFPESYFDKLVSLVISSFDKDSIEVPFLEGLLNDERMFNATGIQVPMVALMRTAPKTSEIWPYAEYHTSCDDYAHADIDSLVKSIDLIKKILFVLENDYTPIPLYKGELFVSRFNGLVYSEMWKQILDITYAMDGKRTISEIASLRKADFFEVKKILDILVAEGAVKYS